MAIIGGSCRFGLWFIHVWWNENTVYQVRFAKTALPGLVPPLLQRFSMGHQVDLSLLNSIAIEPDTLSSRIYSLVRNVPYGSTATYAVSYTHLTLPTICSV